MLNHFGPPLLAYFSGNGLFIGLVTPCDIPTPPQEAYRLIFLLLLSPPMPVAMVFGFLPTPLLTFYIEKWPCIVSHCIKVAGLFSVFVSGLGPVIFFFPGKTLRLFLLPIAFSGWVVFLGIFCLVTLVVFFFPRPALGF